MGVDSSMGSGLEVCCLMYHCMRGCVCALQSTRKLQNRFQQ